MAITTCRSILEVNADICKHYLTIKYHKWYNTKIGLICVIDFFTFLVKVKVIYYSLIYYCYWNCSQAEIIFELRIIILHHCGIKIVSKPLLSMIFKHDSFMLWQVVMLLLKHIYLIWAGILHCFYVLCTDSWKYFWTRKEIWIIHVVKVSWNFGIGFKILDLKL